MHTNTDDCLDCADNIRQGYAYQVLDGHVYYSCAAYAKSPTYLETVARVKAENAAEDGINALLDAHRDATMVSAPELPDVASLASAARALLSILASEGIDIPETRLLAKALDEAGQVPVAWLTTEMLERVAQYKNQPGKIFEVSAPRAWEVTQSDDFVYIAMDENTVEGYDPPSGTND